MDKSIHKISNVHYSPRINSWAIITEMDKSFNISLIANHSPWFKPWAMEMNNENQKRFNGLKNNK
ncbi:MAG: hypothetical protein C0430_08195 [Flavobacterium sp.]|nr:hypothetical protein [Flavobacterium sp.]